MAGDRGQEFGIRGSGEEAVLLRGFTQRRKDAKKERKVMVVGRKSITVEIRLR